MGPVFNHNEDLKNYEGVNPIGERFSSMLSFQIKPVTFVVRCKE